MPPTNSSPISPPPSSPLTPPSTTTITPTQLPSPPSTPTTSHLPLPPLPLTQEPQEQAPKVATCEYTPCKTGPNKDPRKVISHIFGRNKILTKLIPGHIWVHYCRQHYQRARYRARDWPIRQCELLLVSLRRMETWGWIRGFRVVLRKREGVRMRMNGMVERQERGVVVTRSAAARGQSPSPSSSTSSSTSSPSYRDTVASSTPESSPSSPAPKTNHNNKTNNKKKKGTTPKQPRRKPTILPSPVPGWLRDETSVTEERSFAEVISIVNKLKAGFERQRDGDGDSNNPGEKGEREGVVVARFPDIEILPVFVESVVVGGGGRGRRRGVIRKGKGGRR